MAESTDPHIKTAETTWKRRGLFAAAWAAVAAIVLKRARGGRRSNLRIPPVHKHVANILIGQLAGAPGLEVLAQAANQARHRVCRATVILTPSRH